MGNSNQLFSTVFNLQSRSKVQSGDAPLLNVPLTLAHQDAHEAYARARAMGPICYDAKKSEWIVVGYDTAVWAFKNPHILSSKYNNAFDPFVVGNDPPEHTIFRKTMGRAMAGLDASMVELYTAGWLEAFFERTKKNGGLFDAVSDLACPLPEVFTGFMLGLDEEETQKLISMRPPNRTQLNSSWKPVTAYLGSLVAGRAKCDRKGVFGALASLSGEESLSNHEMVGLLRLLWFAGTSTSTHFLPSLILLMLRNPAIVAKLREDISLVPAFVNEALRMEGPTAILPRKAVEDFEFSGVKIPANAMVKICILAANSDPKVFPDPREMRFNRPTASVAFGHGIHFCLGAMIAKTMAAKVTSELASRFPSMSAAQSLDAVQYEASDSFRSIRSLQVRLC
jgi:cytochrome P450